MIASYHGGGCCGRVHIHTLGRKGPYAQLAELPSKVIKSYGSSISSQFYPGKWDTKENGYVHDTVPAEMALERLHRYMLRAAQFKICPEVTTLPDSYAAWEGVLPQLGFEKVYSFVNGNSGNKVNVWLCHGLEYKDKVAEKLIADAKEKS